MSGAIPLLSLYASMEWTVKAILYSPLECPYTHRDMLEAPLTVISCFGWFSVRILEDKVTILQPHTKDSVYSVPGCLSYLSSVFTSA